MKITRMRVGAIATTCAIAGAGAGIAGSSAATRADQSSAASKAAKESRAAKKGQARERRGRGHGGPRIGRRGAPPAHLEAVVLNKAGTAWITRTVDNGVVKSVSGNSLTITEGTTAVPYKDVTVTVPSDATIRRNGKKATLADLKSKDHVHVMTSPDGTKVFAADETFRPKRHGGPDDEDDGPQRR